MTPINTKSEAHLLNGIASPSDALQSHDGVKDVPTYGIDLPSLYREVYGKWNGFQWARFLSNQRTP